MRTPPIAVASAVAVSSTALLVVAIGQGWLGPDVGRGANFCEAARDGLVRQPANTLSNLGFVVAGLLVARRAGSRSPDSVLPMRVATFYACVVVLLGPGSAAMHATQSAWGGHLDMLSMYLVAGFAASWAWVRWTRRGTAAFATAYVACVAACEAAGLWSGPVPVVHYAGNLAFGLLLVAAVVLEFLVWRRAESVLVLRHGVVALAAMLLAFTVWLLSNAGWCDPHSLLQGHAVWHLLCAVAAYWLFRMYASERLRPAA
ncbi:ceramidase domain-containing protein [Nocardioides hwasunensis]|uniref:Ceramidase domain-containing protein n=1 Tax=Nocardioides hwasunensis TaxID=397258 RepID=A0ABR8MFL9_9ACTN|nr:ceramidase domain-containing protein [Nocardioides hwasunensis]MBD3914874.1 ceramidase domain-containing protein [Nocardioides hwasunensis]